MLTLDKVFHASMVLKDVIRETNVVRATGIAPDCTLYLKPENLQNTGSFKLRGSGYKIAMLTEEEKQYIESLFPDEENFEFTHPDRLDATKSVTSICYRSKYGLSWFNAVEGVWKNYKFNIIEC